MSSFGTLLRQMRLTAGLTQEALAERAGLSAKAVGELERSPGRTPRLDTVTLLAERSFLAPMIVRGSSPLLGLRKWMRLRPSHAFQPLHDLPRVLTPLIGRAGVVEAVASLVLRRENPARHADRTRRSWKDAVGHRSRRARCRRLRRRCRLRRSVSDSRSALVLPTVAQHRRR